MRQKPGRRKSHGEKVVKDIRRATRKQYSAEEKIRIWTDYYCFLHAGPKMHTVSTVRKLQHFWQEADWVCNIENRGLGAFLTTPKKV